MKIAPLIHSRTYCCDFSPEFKVRPSKFLDSDIKWARKTVLEATASIDNLRGERWMIADNNRWRIAGVVGFLKDIWAHCDLPEDELTDVEDLFCDDKGRKTYAFIGVVIPASEWDGKIDLTYEFLWKEFYSLVQPVWKRTYQEVIETDFESYQASDNTIPRPGLEPYPVGKKKIYESSSSADYDLFRYYLSSKVSPGFSFCSNITDIATLKSCDFTTITSSPNLITRFKREPANATRSDARERGDCSASSCREDAQGSTSLSTPPLASEKCDGSKKKHFHLSKSCMMICVIAILMLILLMIAVVLSRSRSGLKLAPQTSEILIVILKTIEVLIVV